ncbi:MAG: hypothetical protein AAGJ10_05830 [Bacteroidota bacterium]
MKRLRRHSLFCALLFVLGSVVLPAVHAASHGLHDHDHHHEDGLHDVEHAFDCELCAHLAHVSGTLNAATAETPALLAVPSVEAPVSPLLASTPRALQSPRAPPA